jgi:uncharacterized membrane protein
MTKNIYRPTVLTLVGVATIIAAIAGTAGFIVGRAPMMPPFLAVHFDDDGIADRWLGPSWPLLLIPVWIQLTLTFVFGVIGAMLLYRTRKVRQAVEDETDRYDRERMLYTAEAVSLLAAIWVTLQGLGAVRLFVMWQRMCCGMGDVYYVALVVAIVLSGIVGIRAAAYLQYPKPQPRFTEDSHWRLRGLYFNREDPALFVPLRSGAGWTLNLGRPRAIVLLTIFLGFGIVAPLLILRLLLGE